MQRLYTQGSVMVLLLALWSAMAWGQNTALGTNTTKAVPNDTSTGTTLNRLAKDTPTGAMLATVTDTNIPLWIVAYNGSTTGYALLNLSGVVSCQMDTTTSNVRGFYVIASVTTAGRCHAQAALPPNGMVIGTMIDNDIFEFGANPTKLGLVNSVLISTQAGSGPGTGTMTSLAITPPGEYTVSGSPVTTAGTIVWTKVTQSANTIYAGPASGSAAAPTFRAPVKADLPPQLAMTGKVTPTTLPGDINDYAGCTNGVCRVSGGAADRTWTGVSAGLDGDILVLRNVGTTNALILKEQSASSSAANRFLFGNDITLAPSESLPIIYDTTAPAAWRPLSNGVPDKYKVRQCTNSVGSESVDAPPLADDEDISATCPNKTGKDWVITSVTVYAKTGAPTVTPILTAGSATSIVTGAITGSAGTWVSGTVNGAPVVHSFSLPPNAHVCPVAPCTIDLNITSAGGTVKALTYDVGGVLR